ncbi:MAG: oxidoreductase [Anaerolineae bacterium]|nr:NAD(P)/FAD-dependent oxidoreductase [Anaerolineales bacterium]MCQ3976754.1 oxidoreductase [Anaerolineae bacterium]
MKIAIIGAGVAGLSAAYDLAGAGHNVTIFESAAAVGGLAGGFKSERWAWHLEYFYHHWFESDNDVLDLINEIGAGDKVFFPRPITSLYVDGKIYPFDSPTRMLFFPKLPLLPKLRFGLVGLYLRLTKNWQALEKETAHHWLIRTMGETAYKILWEPLLIGKFGDYYQEVNMAWLWARIHKRSYRLGYFEGGFQAFVDVLAQKVQERGAQLRLNRATTAITRQGDGCFRVQFAPTPPSSPPPFTGGGGGGTETFDRVLLTVSPQLLTQIVPTLPDDYLASLKQLKSMGAVVMILALKQQLTDQHYWINLPKGEGFPFLALVEHTNFIDRRHYGGDHIIYCGDYLPPDHEYFTFSKEELLARFLPSLTRFNSEFDPSWVKESWLFRAKYAQPIPPVNHSTHIPPLETPLPGLYWASMSQVYPWDRGTNYAVEIGRRAARLILESS